MWDWIGLVRIGLHSEKTVRPEEHIGAAKGLGCKEKSAQTGKVSSVC